MYLRPFLLVSLFLIAAAALRATPAHAYPQWQLSTGAARCNQCHYAPGGGGLINSFGRDAVGEELSTFAGNGALLHGVVAPPRWLALGGDLRGAFVANDVQDPAGASTAVFPMQADLAARLAFGLGFSFYGTGGVRGQARNRDMLIPMQSFQPLSTSRLISREHWLMWQPETVGPYVRAGRFYAPFGLRMAEHILYVRRDLGFNMLAETYNLSGGFVLEHAELHVTAFMRDFVRHIGSDERGVALYYEHRVFDDRVALAGQGRVAQGPGGVTRSMLGAVTKAYTQTLRTLFFLEANLVELSFEDRLVTSRDQLVGAAGAALFPVRGVMATVIGERSQQDLDTADSGWTATTLLLNWFPYAHTELQVMGRLQLPDGGAAAKTVLAQLHYFL